MSLPKPKLITYPSIFSLWKLHSDAAYVVQRQEQLHKLKSSRLEITKKQIKYAMKRYIDN